jgi:hypothetical protein
MVASMALPPSDIDVGGGLLRLLASFLLFLVTLCYVFDPDRAKAILGVFAVLGGMLLIACLALR